jgi:pentose-5-phosphate-3-epimerase
MISETVARAILSVIAGVLLVLLCIVVAEARAQTFTESMTQAGAALETRMQQVEKASAAVDGRIQQAEKAAIAATARADEVFAALQVETADIAAINIASQRLADEMSLLRKEYAAALARLDALEAAQKLQPQVRLQAITVAVPANPP